MLVFNLTIHHLWGRVLSKFPETRTVEYVDDGYINDVRTDVFVQNFVVKTCRAIIDVEKLDSIQDGFIHYQLLRFCQATRL